MAWPSEGEHFGSSEVRTDPKKEVNGVYLLSAGLILPSCKGALFSRQL